MMGAALSSPQEATPVDSICAEITNSTGLPHMWYQQSGPEGERQDVLVLRGTFDFGVDGRTMKLAEVQRPIVYGDATDSRVPGDLIRSVIVDDGDLVPYKPCTDILVTGCASAPDSKPTKNWVAAIRVGNIKKALRLHGPREFKHSAMGWTVGATTPVTSVPLDYRLAFGGCIDVPAELTTDGEPDWVRLRSNPAGSGWLPRPENFGKLAKSARSHVEKWIQSQKVLAAPQIEDAFVPVRNPYSNAAPAGMAAIARWWAPRVGLQGKFDDEWRRVRYPLLPKDFSARYFQCASAGLVASPHLAGDETVTMVGLLPQRREMQLPCWEIIVGVIRASGDVSLYLALLDTVRFDLSRHQASLVWRIPFGYDDPVVDVAIGSMLKKVSGERQL